MFFLFLLVESGLQAICVLVSVCDIGQLLNSYSIYSCTTNSYTSSRIFCRNVLVSIAANPVLCTFFYRFSSFHFTSAITSEVELTPTSNSVWPTLTVIVTHGWFHLVVSLEAFAASYGTRVRILQLLFIILHVLTPLQITFSVSTGWLDLQNVNGVWCKWMCSRSV